MLPDRIWKWLWLIFCLLWLYLAIHDLIETHWNDALMSIGRAFLAYILAGYPPSEHKSPFLRLRPKRDA